MTTLSAAARPNRFARGFTLVELIVVIVVLAILAGVAVPKYFDYAASAREAACRGLLGGVREAIGAFRRDTAVQGTLAWPTLAQLQTPGSVMAEELPENPYNNSRTVQAATWAATPPTSGSAGWNYDAATGRFWANTATVGENTW